MYKYRLFLYKYKNITEALQSSRAASHSLQGTA